MRPLWKRSICWQKGAGDEMFTVSPSIYSADLLDLKTVLDKAKDFEHIHLDIDDGNFVKGISFGCDLVCRIASYTSVPLDVHLEVLNPMDHVDELAEAGVEMISAHVEALEDVKGFLDRVHGHGIKAGLALNPGTDIETIRPYKDDIDILLLVSVVSGMKGLPFQTSVLKKVEMARKMLKEEVPIWVDGGINDENLKDVVCAGADGVVIGRAVFKADDFKKAYDHFIDMGRRYERQVRGNG
ncbi:MAG: ribulose-phosphate 3-epimerase [Erysipelotrichaceae bacterium]|nr:ribulose-phosphate 3-epimerase [Erysipelotrichaceae bacterium]